MSSEISPISSSASIAHPDKRPRELRTRRLDIPVTPSELAAIRLRVGQRSLAEVARAALLDLYPPKSQPGRRPHLPPTAVEAAKKALVISCSLSLNEIAKVALTEGLAYRTAILTTLLRVERALLSLKNDT
jgi:hypothetical protein